MISVVTPTYNRAYILGELFESLKQQSNRHFEWLVVDDGSTDDTRALVDSWKKENPSFEICYLRKENGGKHRALNFAIPQAKGEYIFIVDSDDHLVPEAIESVYSWIETIRGNETIAGVAGLRGYPDGKRIGDYPQGKEYIDVKNSHRYMHHLDGDKAEIYRKDLLVSHPFPEFEGEKFIGEGAVWNQLSLEGYKVRWFNKVIYIGNYLPDGLTSNLERLNKNNFQGYTNNAKLNVKALVFPYNLMAAAVYTTVAGELGHDFAWVKEVLELNGLQALFIKLLRAIRRMK